MPEALASSAAPTASMWEWFSGTMTFTCLAVAGGDDLVERLDDGGVARHAADAVDGLLEGSLLQSGHHAGDAAAQGVEHGPDRDTLLLQVDEVGLGEDAAPGGDAGWLPLEFQRQAGEVLHGDAQAVGLLLQEHARAGGAQRVGGHAPGLAEPVNKLHNEGALTADLDYGLGIRMKVEHAGGDGQRTAVLQPVQFLWRQGGG